VDFKFSACCDKLEEKTLAFSPEKFIITFTVCGIIGYLGDKQALPFLLSGLKNLEYRGYDSCGVALVEGGKLKIVKTKGEVDNLIKKTRGLKSKATLGIGHTRWATHGKPSTINAHPHLDCSGRLCVVHNGIIENFEALKSKLEAEGHKFTSQTDTEVLAHLIEGKLNSSPARRLGDSSFVAALPRLRRGGARPAGLAADEVKTKKDLYWAVCEALKEVVGAYGVAVISVDFPDEIIVGRLSSPLILGFGKKENFVASDQPALISWTKNLATLQDGQIAKISRSGVEIRTINGQSAHYKKIEIEEETREVSKSHFPHFMLKEIFEQEKVVEDGLRGRFGLRKGVKLGGIEPNLNKFTKAKMLPIIACGTSYHAALIGKYFFQNLANLPTVVEDATELVATQFPWEKSKPAVFVSQSGETADVLTSLRQAKKKGAACFGLVNVAGSSVARETGAGVYTRAGFEVGVAATKTFTAQVLAFLLWALMVGEKRGKPREKKLLKGISQLPDLIESILQKSGEVRKAAAELKNKEKIFFLGRGLSHAVSLEGALKIKEIAYLPAEGLPAGELKHGPLALVDEKTVLVFLAPKGSDFKKNLNTIHEAAARGPRAIVLTNKKDKAWRKLKARVYYFPRCHPLLSAFPMVVWLQLLAYYLAYFLGRPIDKPRNLAKSVTVE
jgi:glucosamine--fructose-6-phosphate aminotransferase (isomerizing)